MKLEEKEDTFFFFPSVFFSFFPLRSTIQYFYVFLREKCTNKSSAKKHTESWEPAGTPSPSVSTTLPPTSTPPIYSYHHNEKKVDDDELARRHLYSSYYYIITLSIRQYNYNIYSPTKAEVPSGLLITTLLFITSI